MTDRATGDSAEDRCDETVRSRDELLTTGEVARLFRVARSTVTSWAYRGLLPYTTTPTGRLRFHRASIERRLAERDLTERGPLGRGRPDDHRRRHSADGR